MPIIAVSPPLVFGATPTPTPRVTPALTPTPAIVATPAPPIIGLSSFVVRHGEFIAGVDQLGSCFRRSEVGGFTDQEFADHSRIAIQDRYLTQEGDMFCSMQGIQVLAKALKRLGEE